MAVHAELAAAGWVLTSTDVRSHALTLSRSHALTRARRSFRRRCRWVLNSLSLSQRPDSTSLARSFAGWFPEGGKVWEKYGLPF